MKTLLFKSLMLFLFIVFLAPVKSQNTDFKEIPLDSLSNISIKKLIYYQEPLYFKRLNLTNKSYLPDWYEAECAKMNVSNMKASEKAKYYSKKLEIKEEDLARMDKDTAIINARKRHLEKKPSKIIYGEVHLTIIKTGQLVVLTLSTINEKEFGDLKFQDPVKKNHETINENGTYLSPTVYIYEDGILKVADQYEIISQFTDNLNEVGNFGLEAYQDMLFRSKGYIKSNIENGKRVFETMENNGEDFKVKKVSNKPD